MRQPPLPPSLTGRTGPAIIVRTGPAGADVARAHLRHGGSLDALVEAAALSLAQEAMADGRLDPARYATWAQHRVAFLSQIPDAASWFGTVADAERTVNAIVPRAAVARGHAPAYQQDQPSSPPVRHNALMPLARTHGRLGSPHSSLYSR